MRRQSIRRLLPLLGLTLALWSAAAYPATEAELRAAVIYNIARFVRWPQTSAKATHFDICTVGSNAVSDALKEFTDKPLDGLPTAVRRVERDRDLHGCRMLYITPDDALRMAAISDILTRGHDATLTISDAPGFIALGGMVQLIVVNDRQRFRIDRVLADKANLSINAKLLQLALPGE